MSRTAFIAALLFAGAAHAQTTQAERVSSGVEEASPARIERFQSDCGAWVRAGTDTTVAGAQGMVTHLPEVKLLILVGFAPGGGDEAAVVRFDDLPFGGITATDFCDQVQLELTPDQGHLGMTRAFGLRLRPGLDLAQDYPSSWQAISANGQLLDLGPSSYFVLQADADVPEDPAFADLVDFSRPVLQTARGIFFPLRD